MLEICGAASSAGHARPQYLVPWTWAREAGITIKLQSVRLEYGGSHTLHLILAGPWSFGYEVSRSLIHTLACEGWSLSTPAQGIEAQTTTATWPWNTTSRDRGLSQQIASGGQAGWGGDRARARHPGRDILPHLGQDGEVTDLLVPSSVAVGSERSRSGLIFDSTDQFRGVISSIEYERPPQHRRRELKFMRRRDPRRRRAGVRLG